MRSDGRLIMLTQTLDQQYLAHTYNRFPLEIVGGKGSLLRGADGREYIDLGSGIGVNIFGMDDDEWRNAVTAQLGRFQHVSNLYYSEPAAKLAQMLCERTGLKRVFFSNSGAESNECAIKAARKWAAEHKGPEYCSIITLRGSFHGRTLGTLAATGQDVFHRDYQPLPGLRSVTGMGLMLGLEIDIPAREFAERALREGVLVTTAKQKIRLLPALNIPMELLKTAAQALVHCAAE